MREGELYQDSLNNRIICVLHYDRHSLPIFLELFKDGRSSVFCSDEFDYRHLYNPLIKIA